MWSLVSFLFWPFNLPDFENSIMLNFLPQIIIHVSKSLPLSLRRVPAISVIKLFHSASLLLFAPRGNDDTCIVALEEALEIPSVTSSLSCWNVFRTFLPLFQLLTGDCCKDQGPLDILLDFVLSVPSKNFKCCRRVTWGVPELLMEPLLDISGFDLGKVECGWGLLLARRGVILCRVHFLNWQAWLSCQSS